MLLGRHLRIAVQHHQDALQLLAHRVDAVGGGARRSALLSLGRRGHSLGREFFLALPLALEVVGTRLGVCQPATTSRQVPRSVSTWLRAASSSASALSSASLKGRDLDGHQRLAGADLLMVAHQHAAHLP